MIKNKNDYKEYVEEDARVNHFNWKTRLFSPLNRYLLYLRKAEYYTNCKKIGAFWFRHKMRKYGVKLGLTIGLNCFGKGLYIPHYGCIVVNGSARFGNYCVIQCGTNISENVVGGDHIYIGAGAKILTGVRVAENVIIGANAVVVKNIEVANTVWAGVPVKMVSEKGFATDRTYI